jgi:lactate dehydrogenase-like 2-hydroxyacid dehydrogenase
MPNQSAKILSIGQMDKPVEEALVARFDVYRADASGLDGVIRSVGAEIKALVTRGRDHITAELMERLPNLELIATYGVGYDSIDVEYAAKRGIVVTNTPDVLNGEMADFAVSLLLATVRRLPQADRFLRSGRWSKGEKFPLGTSLRGRRIGIASMGRIGRVIAKRLQGFDVPISYFGRRLQADLPYPFFADLAAMAETVDTLLIVLPGSPDTSKIVDARVLSALGSDGILINVARGSVVDEEALIHALQTGVILAAGLDVYEHEPDVPAALLEMEQVVLLPHIGTATHHTRELMGQLQVQNVLSWFDGKGPVTPVKETPWIQNKAT